MANVPSLQAVDACGDCLTVSSNGRYWPLLFARARACISHDVREEKRRSNVRKHTEIQKHMTRKTDSQIPNFLFHVITERRKRMLRALWFLIFKKLTVEIESF